MLKNSSGLAGNGIGLDHSDQTALAHFKERHYSVDEVAEMWGLSPDPVRKLFEHEPGVLVLGNHASRGKRRYTTLRIPESVVERVYRRLCNVQLAQETQIESYLCTATRARQNMVNFQTYFRRPSLADITALVRVHSNH